jgi:peroxiredoxin Q/BCP
VDSTDTNQKFAESLGVDYPILSDPGKDVARAYGVVGGDRQAAARWTFYIGIDGRLLYIDKDVKTTSHGKDVAARLAELGVARSR